MYPVHFEPKLIHGPLFTENVISPTEAERMSPHLPGGMCSQDIPNDTPCSGLCPSTKDANALTRDQLQALWHMCLGHINERLASEQHKHVDGVPALPHSDASHSCPICAQDKLHKANHGNADTTNATNCWQDVQINFGFFVQRHQKL